MSDSKRIYAYIIGILSTIPLINYIFIIDVPPQNTDNIATIGAITVGLYIFIIITSLKDYFDGCFSFKKSLLIVGLILSIGYVLLFRIDLPIYYVDKMSQFDCDKSSKNIVKEVVKDNQITFYDYIRAAYEEGSCISREKELIEKKKKMKLINKIQKTNS